MTMTVDEASPFLRRASALADEVPERIEGRVVQLVGLVIECEGLAVPVGSYCRIRAEMGRKEILAEVIGFREDRALLMPLGEPEGIRRGDVATWVPGGQTVGFGPALLGRVLDAHGNPLDGGPPVMTAERRPLHARGPGPLDRAPIRTPLATGVRAIDALATFGRGQRVGLFSGSGVGKSRLLGMIARETSAAVSVIALVGERGREVREFLERDLGPEGRKRSVVVVATSDQPAPLRVKAPFTASAIAEGFRDLGMDVMLLMDSVTRMANAQREIGLSAGEPPATKGYPPSVFAQMPRLMERAGPAAKGSITAVYTVLVDADDMNEPIADHARSILDGHIWLSRDLAHRGHYPAIDVLGSVSRLMMEVTPPEHRKAASAARAMLAAYRASEDLINIGAYVPGANPELDRAVRMMPKLNAFLRQDFEEKAPFAETGAKLAELAAESEAGVPGKAAASAPAARGAAAPSGAARPAGAPAGGPAPARGATSLRPAPGGPAARPPFPGPGGPVPRGGGRA